MIKLRHKSMTTDEKQWNSNVKEKWWENEITFTNAQ